MLIFLDIDGVMVPAKSWNSPALLSDGFYEFSAKATHVLQSLVREGDTVMLTTSHKSRYSISEWKEIFRNRGIVISELRTLEENRIGISRRDEILNWFNLNRVTEEFIIIDDDKSLNNLPPFLKENLILTSPLVGLTHIHLDAIKSKMENKRQFV
jgi:hypothetical protein